MDRRSFLKRIGGIAIGVPLILQATACGSDSNASDGAKFVSTNVDQSDHTHELTIFCTALKDNGATFSAGGSGHAHTVGLSADQLSKISNGETVTVDTNDRHAHTWVIKMPSGICA